jgi:hypothetical protein
MKHFFFLFLLLCLSTVPVLAQRARTTSQGIHYIKLANTLREVHKSADAIDLLERALPVFKGRYLYWEAVTHELLGLTHNDQLDTARALRYLKTARSQYQKLRYVASAWAVNEIIRDISGTNLYAGVQIGATDLKLVILKTDYETDFYEKDVRAVIEIPDVRLTDVPLSADVSSGLRTGPNALKACFDSIQRYNIPGERTFVVLSSEVRDNLSRQPEARKRLYEQLSRALPSPAVRIDTTLSPAREARLFTVGAIPRQVWPTTSALAIGASSTRGGYFDGQKTFHPLTLPVGLSTLVDQIESRRSLGMEAYRREAQRVVGTIADTTLARHLNARNRGLLQRRTVGVGGDVVWALVTYLHPEQARLTAVAILPEDVERFKRLALSDYRTLTRPNLDGITDPAVRSQVERDLVGLQEKLSEKELIAGALWLEALMKKYDSPSTPKRFVFVRNADIGWVTGKFLETINYEYESTIAKGALYTR